MISEKLVNKQHNQLTLLIIYATNQQGVFDFLCFVVLGQSLSVTPNMIKGKKKEDRIDKLTQGSKHAYMGLFMSLFFVRENGTWRV